MRRQLQSAAVLFAASLTLAACSDRPVGAPTSPDAARPSFALSLPPAVCDINALKSYSRDYALSNRDALNDAIAAVQAQARSGKSAALTNLAFDGLARLAVMRGDAGLQKTGAAAKAAFDGLTKGFIGCTEDYIRTSAVAEDFSLAVGLGWMFEVRGASGPTGAAYEKGGSPYWSANAAWATALTVAAPPTTTPTNRILIYGFDLALYPYPVNDAKIAGEGFEIRTIPAQPTLSFASPVTVGLCEVFAPTPEALGKYRAEHKTDILKLTTPACTRPSTPVFSPQSASVSFDALRPTMLARRAVAFFAPQSLNAAAFAVGSVGGAVSELSPSIVVDLKSLVLTITSQPVDGIVSAPIQGTDGEGIKVRVQTEALTLLPGTNVTLSVAGNSGTNAIFYDPKINPTTGLPIGNTVTVTRTTESNGVASFAGVRVIKAGGYLFTARATYDTSVSGLAVTTVMANFQGK